MVEAYPRFSYSTWRVSNIIIHQQKQGLDVVVISPGGGAVYAEIHVPVEHAAAQHSCILAEIAGVESGHNFFSGLLVTLAVAGAGTQAGKLEQPRSGYGRRRGILESFPLGVEIPGWNVILIP